MMPSLSFSAPATITAAAVLASLLPYSMHAYVLDAPCAILQHVA
jgi:hypothetical protein